MLLAAGLFLLITTAYIVVYSITWNEHSCKLIDPWVSRMNSWTECMESDDEWRLRWEKHEALIMRYAKIAAHVNRRKWLWIPWRIWNQDTQRELSSLAKICIE